MERIVVKLVDPSPEPDGLSQQAAEVAGEVPQAEVVRVSGSGRVLLSVPDGVAAHAAAHLSALDTVAWAEPDGSDSAQTEAVPPDLPETGITQPADGDPQTS